jgi:Mg2+/Co2+ transporter CorC
LVYANLGRIPAVGDTVAVDGVTITVEEIDRRAIRTVRLRSDRPFEIGSEPSEGGSPPPEAQAASESS